MNQGQKGNTMKGTLLVVFLHLSRGRQHFLPACLLKPASRSFLESVRISCLASRLFDQHIIILLEISPHQALS
jgi:hypothetical protein